MGATGIREKARLFLTQKTRADGSAELEQTRKELDELKAQMAELIAARKPGRPKKEPEGS